MTKELDLAEIREMFNLLLQRLPLEESSAEEYGTYLMRWYNSYKVPKNGVNTSMFMLFYITKRIMPVLGNIPINRLTGDQIQNFLVSIDAGNTRTKIAQIIKGSLTKAVKLRLIKYNPFDAVELIPYKKKHYRALSCAEQNVVFGYLKNNTYKSVGRVLLCSGLRIGEFLALDDTCIDTENRLIKVYRSVDIRSNELQNRTKTYTSVRCVPYLKILSPDIKNIIDYVRKNGRFTYDMIKSCFFRVYKALDISGCNLHTFRHTFGCMCYRVGLNEKYIQRIMGHASLDVTMNIYVDVLGNGVSIFDNYFKLYRNDVENRPTDFWRLAPSQN